jgi:hypothetical protein
MGGAPGVMGGAPGVVGVRVEDGRLLPQTIPHPAAQRTRVEDGPPGVSARANCRSLHYGKR